MKKSKRFFITGSLQPRFFNQFIKENADKLGVRGFVRKLEDNRIEVFIEGNSEAVAQMTPLCRRGPQHTLIRKVDEQDERFQDFKDFKILNF